MSQQVKLWEYKRRLHLQQAKVSGEDSNYRYVLVLINLFIYFLLGAKYVTIKFEKWIQ